MQNFRHFFYFSYFVSLPKKTFEKMNERENRKLKEQLGNEGKKSAEEEIGEAAGEDAGKSGNVDVVQQLEELSVTTIREKQLSDPRDNKEGKEGLRPVVIDGSNVAYCHGDDQVFSIRGIEIVVDDFINRGHEKIVIFLPQKHEKEKLLMKLEEKCSVIFIRSRQQPSGENINHHDDYYILNYAAKHGAVVVTRDNFRDHANNPRHPEWDAVITDRILMPTFVGDDIQWPEDPLGRTGPCLQDFLKF